MILEAFDLSVKTQTRSFHVEPNTVPGPQPMCGANEGNKMSVRGKFPLPRHDSDVLQEDGAVPPTPAAMLGPWEAPSQYL